MRNWRILAVLLMVASVLLIGVGALGCGGGDGDPDGSPPPADGGNGAPAEDGNGAPAEDGNGAPAEEVELVITSPTFENGESVPVQYTCDGQDISPELVWSGMPQATQSFVLIVDDIDAPAGTFTHWVIFNIPADALGLDEAIPTSGQLTSGALQGTNGFGTIGYGGPCPPPETEHRYYFTVYALDTTLELAAGATKAQVLEAMTGHILDEAELVGTYY